jgi:hypothetical protein
VLSQANTTTAFLFIINAENSIWLARNEDVVTLAILP